MKTNILFIPDFRQYYLSEYELFDGESYVTFNLVGIDTTKNEIQTAVTDRGKISVITYDLMVDKSGRIYYEYGPMFEKIYIDEFNYQEN